MWVFLKIHFVGYSLSFFSLKTHVLGNILDFHIYLLPFIFSAPFLKLQVLDVRSPYFLSAPYIITLSVLLSYFPSFFFYSLVNFLNFIFQTLLNYSFVILLFISKGFFVVVEYSSFLKRNLYCHFPILFLCCSILFLWGYQ